MTCTSSSSLRLYITAICQSQWQSGCHPVVAVDTGAEFNKSYAMWDKEDVEDGEGACAAASDADGEAAAANTAAPDAAAAAAEAAQA